ncbi:MAG: hypothetical protein U0Z53_30770 [Blastocatellia bacterium]
MSFNLRANPFKRRHKSNHWVLKLIGGAAAAAVAAGVITSLPDIKRYIRISSM